MAEEHKELDDQLKIEEEREHQTDDAPVTPVAGVVYGDTVYWGTIAAAILTLVGQVVNFVSQNNHIAPSYLLSAIWQGKDVDNIWGTAVGAAPDGHWYMGHLTAGDGLTTAGIALGVFVVVPAIIAAAVVLFKQRERLFGAMALIAAAITVVAMGV